MLGCPLPDLAAGYEKMLAQTLKVLEAEGLVLRKEWDEKPTRVEYCLSEGGTRISRRMQKCIAELYAELDRRPGVA